MHLFNVYHFPIFISRASYDYLLTVEGKKDSFGPFLQVF